MLSAQAVRLFCKIRNCIIIAVNHKWSEWPQLILSFDEFSRGCGCIEKTIILNLYLSYEFCKLIITAECPTPILNKVINQSLQVFACAKSGACISILDFFLHQSPHFFNFPLGKNNKVNLFNHRDNNDDEMMPSIVERRFVFWF